MSDPNNSERNIETAATKVEQISLAEDVKIEPPIKTDKKKIDILLKATGNAPILKQKKWAVEQDKTIGSIIIFIKKALQVKPPENVFLYVNQAFAPAPDQLVRNLYDCFGADGKLVLHYCKSQAWG